MFVIPSVRSSVRSSPLGPLRPDIWPLRPEIYPLRPGICPLRPEICSLPCKSGQRVSLTTYCPWATCCITTPARLFATRLLRFWPFGQRPRRGQPMLLPYGKFSPPPPHPSPPSYPHPSRPISQPRGSYPSVEAQIPTSRPKSQSQGPNSSLKGFGPQNWDLGLEARILALKLRHGSGAVG